MCFVTQKQCNFLTNRIKETLKRAIRVPRPSSSLAAITNWYLGFYSLLYLLLLYFSNQLKRLTCRASHTRGGREYFQNSLSLVWDPLSLVITESASASFLLLYSISNLLFSKHTYQQQFIPRSIHSSTKSLFRFCSSSSHFERVNSTWNHCQLKSIKVFQSDTTRAREESKLQQNWKTPIS